MSSLGVVESLKESIEDLLSADLALVGGIVSLFGERGAELDGGDEERAGFADRFEVAIQLDGPGAVAVAEHPAVGLGAELAHLGRLVFGGQDCGLVFVVEGFDFLGDGEVLVGDGAVGDLLWRRQILELSECLPFADARRLISAA
ncbi:hypothetical protein [Rhodococcus jostii]|uniref:hypothetical protein n=1 Tax=Rhodococcus jostii TaxID=132919 RepID=UPI00157D03E7|nr:hypothetical protein [Rhodococcus jostii]